MSVNFYDNSGWMLGVDLHAWCAAPQPFVTTAPFCWPPATWNKRTGSVTSDGWQMIQGGFDLYAVPHIPTTPPVPPHPLAVAAAYAKIIAFASSKAHLKVHSVTGQGKALATCIYGPVGLNGNCNDPMALLTGAVLNLNSVKTQPSIGDYVASYFDYAFSSIASFFMGRLAKRAAERLGKPIVAVILKHLYRRRKDILPTPDPIDAVTKAIQQLVDDVATKVGI